MKVTEIVKGFAEPIVEEAGCTLWDTEYVREGGEWYLRLYIDKEGGVDINDCEKISRAVEPILDEKDPIPESYCFEVCSAGLGRTLKRPEHFAKCMGEEIELKLYKPVDGVKELTGILSGYNAGAVTVTVGEEEKTYEKAEVALVRLKLDF